MLTFAHRVTGTENLDGPEPRGAAGEGEPSLAKTCPSFLPGSKFNLSEIAYPSLSLQSRLPQAEIFVKEMTHGPYQERSLLSNLA